MAVLRQCRAPRSVVLGLPLLGTLLFVVNDTPSQNDYWELVRIVSEDVGVRWLLLVIPPPPKIEMKRSTRSDWQS
eukprot:scaffold13323_cov207-Alexandrium_tamarense.AAC.22